MNTRTCVALCWLMLWPSILCGQEISSPTLYREQSFDVLHYDAMLALDSLPRPVLSTSVCTWQVWWRRDPDTIRFHLRSLSVEQVEYLDGVNAYPAEWYARGTPNDATFHYAVPALPSHRRGDTIVLRITYRGTMTGEPTRNGFSWGGVQQEGSIVYALGVGFYNNYVSATQHWLACYDHPSDKATFRLRFRVPASYVVASNGEELPPTLGAGWQVFTFQSEHPIATYLLTFAALPQSVVTTLRDTTSLPVPIVLYARRSDSLATVRSFRLLPRMVQTYQRLYGPYPFEKVGYVMTQKGAMEHQTMISYPTSLARSGDTVNLVAAHELAHQWFGDCVTPYDFRDAWFNESFATFSESLWREELGGYSAYLDEQQRKINAYLNQYAKPGNPAFEGVLTMYDFDRTPPASNYPHVIYEKGAAVLGMLRWLMGDSAFFGWCRYLMQRYRFGNISIDSLEQSASAFVSMAGMVPTFFNEWVRGKGWAVLRIEAVRLESPHGWKAVLSVTQVQPDSLGIYTTLPVELSFVGKDTVHRTVVLTAREQTIELDSLNAFSTLAVNIGRRVRSLVLLSSNPVVSETAVETEQKPLVIYPSPASERVLIIMTRPLDAPIAIYDARGVLVQTVSQMRATLLPTTDMPAGIYYAVAHTNKQQFMVPFVVVH
ncbi:MAG: peptidase M1 [Candidatus Kapaibacterium sp.]|nr:MAG: peptidase M1 [Candidatus Kapabacteria bacterium]